MKAEGEEEGGAFPEGGHIRTERIPDDRRVKDEDKWQEEDIALVSVPLLCS